MSSLVCLRSSGEACFFNDGLSITRLSQTLKRCPSSFNTRFPHLSCLIFPRPPLWTRQSFAVHGPALLIPPSFWKPCPFVATVCQARWVSAFEPAPVPLASDSCGFDDDLSNSDEEKEAKPNDAGVDEKRPKESYLVVNFYLLVEIEDPELEVKRHRCFMKDKDIHGRIYLSSQGINAQYSGPSEHALAYAEWVRQDPRFSSLYVQVSPSFDGHAFPRFKLQNKPSLVQVEGGTTCLPITDPASRAIPLTPQEWRDKLELAQMSSIVGDQSTMVEENSCHQMQRKIILLDVRNGYEWDVGHFKGAQRPGVDCFRNTEFGLKNRESNEVDPLAHVDKEHIDVLMYCTGGIRCDVYSAILRLKGFKNLYTLKGGVARYLNEENAEHWLGNLFVFDSRLAVAPQAHKLGLHNSRKSIEDMKLGRMDAEGLLSVGQQSTFGRCSMCNCLLSSIRHRNCANVDCNKLFFSCESCGHQLKGCCSVNCTTASRLRPFLTCHQGYERWHNYRATDQTSPRPPGFVSKRAMKRRLRKEQCKQTQMVTQETNDAQKDQLHGIVHGEL